MSTYLSCLYWYVYLQHMIGKISENKRLLEDFVWMMVMYYLRLLGRRNPEVAHV